jgi:putative hemin transport protein
VLFAAHEGTSVTRLDGNWGALLDALGRLGACIVITSNAHATLEQVGSFSRMAPADNITQIQDGDFELRIDWSHIFDGFIVQEPRDGFSQGIHLFDHAGSAVLRILPRADDQQGLFSDLVRRHGGKPEAFQPKDVLEPSGSRGERPDPMVDAVALRTLWASFQDEDALQQILDKAGIRRHQALRLIGPEWAEQAIAKGSYLEVLRSSVASELPIRVTVRNTAVAHGYVGSVTTARRSDGFVQVAGRGVSLTIDERGIADSWIVRVPNGLGLTTCLELYDDTEKSVLCLRDQGPSRIGSGQWGALLRQPPLAIPQVRICPDQGGNT